MRPPDRTPPKSIRPEGTSASAHSEDTEEHTPRVKKWAARINSSRKALHALFWASFAETIIVPIPIEFVLIPFMATNRHRLWRTATVVTAGCLVAALVGYGVGYLFFDTIGQDIIGYFGWTEPLERFRGFFAEYGFFAILAVGVIPIPFQIAMLTAGAAKYPLILFVAAAAIARGVRYYGLALLVYYVGPRAEELWKRDKTAATLVASAILAAIVAGMIWL